MVIRTVSERGEVVIPQKIRQKVGLRGKVEIVSVGKAVILTPVKRFRELAGLFGKSGVKNVGELDASIAELFGA